MSIAKYLARHAEPAPAGLEALAQLGPWRHALVGPARQETLACVEAAAAPARRGSVLCVLVVNASAEDVEDRRVGGELLAALEAAHPRRFVGPGLSLHRVGDLDLLALDRCREQRAFAAGEGVGLARKIGADLILRLVQAGALSSPWIHSTDADARLPPEHFARVAALGEEPRAPAAAVAPFWHVEGEDPATNQATAAYEAGLRYWVAGLRFAGSPYAFHTIGSLISVSCPAYAGVRGFPRRRAGEDFYLLNKIAKLGPVCSLDGPPVKLQSRRSTRVPFGTGPAVEQLLARGGAELEVYDPRVFECLARVLAGLRRLAERDDSSTLDELCDELCDVAELAACREGALELAERYPGEGLARRLHERFDGFRTLKLIHALTAERWPKLPWSRAIERAVFVDFDASLPLDEQRRRLHELE